jgi:hypothetical protein
MKTKFILLIVLLWTMVQARADIIHRYSLTVTQPCQSPASIMIINVNQLPYLWGQPVDELSVFRWKNDADGDFQWQAVAIQIDQKDEANRYIISPEEARNTLAKQDELVIASDSPGKRLAPQSDIANQNNLVEVELIDPLKPQEKQWLYINVSPGRLTSEAQFPSLLSYDSSLDQFNAARYKIAFSKTKPFLVDQLFWRINSQDWSEDIADMMKIRHQGKFFGLPFKRSQSDYYSRLVGVKQGPLRAIRRTENRVRVFLGLKTPALYIDYLMMPDGFVMDTTIDIPFKIALFFKELETFTTMDWDPGHRLPGFSISTATLTEPIVVQGKMTDRHERFNGQSAHHFVVEHDSGRFDVRLQMPDNFPVKAMLYLKDDEQSFDPPENVPGQYGNVGFKTIGWENIDTKQYHLKFSVCLQGSVL